MSLLVLIPLVALGLLCLLLAAVVGALVLRRAESRAVAVIDRQRALHATLRAECRRLRAELQRRGRRVRRLRRTIRRLREVIEELHAARHEERDPWQPLRHEVALEELALALDRAETLEGQGQQLAEALARVEELTARAERQLADVDAELQQMRCRALEVTHGVGYLAASQRARNRGERGDS